MKRLLIAIFGLFTSAFSYAATWTSGLQVVELVIWKPTHHGFYTSMPTAHDPEGCGNGRLYIIDPTLDEKTVDRLYAMMLAANATGKTVYIWVDGCIGTQPKFTGLQIN